MSPVSCPHCLATITQVDVSPGQTVFCAKCTTVFVWSLQASNSPNDTLLTVPGAGEDQPVHDDDGSLQANESAPAHGIKNKEPSGVWVGLFIATAFVMVLFGMYVGTAVLIVGTFGLIFGAAFYFATTGQRRAMAPAGAIQAGHAFWMFLGAMLIQAGIVPGARLPSQWVFVEAALFFACSVALILHPRLIPVLALTGYHAAMIVVNLVAFSKTNDAEAGKFLLFHVALRVFGVAFMYEAYLCRRSSHANMSRHAFVDNEKPTGVLSKGRGTA